MTLMKFKMNNLSIEEINCIYRCISMSMDWRDAVDKSKNENINKIGAPSHGSNTRLSI